MIIRQASEQDILEIIKLVSCLDKQHEGYDPYFSVKENPEKLMVVHYQKIIESNKDLCLVAEENGQLVGYAFGKIEESAEYYKEEKFGMLNEIFVSEACRKKGIANLMLEKMYSWLRIRGVNHIELEVASPNTLAQSIWQKKGFTTYLHKMRKAI